MQERRDSKFRLALGSFLEEFNNRVEIVTVRAPARTRSAPQARRCRHCGGCLLPGPGERARPSDRRVRPPLQLDDEADPVVFRSDPKYSFAHPYPATKIMFIPDKEGTREDLLATTGDFLRIWKISDEGVKLQSLLNNNKNSEFCAPLTSFDWNEMDPKRLGTSSIDTTCTIWDIEKEVVDTQAGLRRPKRKRPLAAAVRAR